MTQEDRNLLLIDLCARLPYGVVCIDKYADEKFINKWKVLAIDGTFGNEFLQVCISNCKETYGYKTSITNVKPYLLPLSSMSEEQQKEYNTFSLGPDWVSNPYYNVPAFEVLDWLNAHHFDYRGLINKGLAIDATNLNIYGKRI